MAHKRDKHGKKKWTKTLDKVPNSDEQGQKYGNMVNEQV